MNFRPELAEAVVAGRKTVTRRAVSDNPRSPYSPERAPRMVGKVIAVCPGRGKVAIGAARVQSVTREIFNPVGITDAEARREGFTDWEAFLDTWQKLHGNRLPRDVWRIELEPVPPEATE